MQVKLCDPCLSALCVPWCKKGQYKYSSFPFSFTVLEGLWEYLQTRVSPLKHGPLSYNWPSIQCFDTAGSLTTRHPACITPAPIILRDSVPCLSIPNTSHPSEGLQRTWLLLQLTYAAFTLLCEHQYSISARIEARLSDPSRATANHRRAHLHLHDGRRSADGRCIYIFNIQYNKNEKLSQN